MAPWLDLLPGSLQFLRPHALWGLLVLPIVWVAWRVMQRRSPWAGIVDPHLQAHVLERANGSRAGGPWLWLVLLGLGVIALAGPAWREAPQPAWQAAAATVLVLDLSTRTWTADLPPDRLTHARLKIARLLELQREQPLGLVVFAASAHTVSPITRDVETLRSLLDALSPELMPVDGQDLAAAIGHAQALLERAGHAGGRLLVLTDRADDAALSAARTAASSGHTVSVLGLGRETGAPVRGRDGGFATGHDGRTPIARLDPASLQALAAAGNGRYRPLVPDDGDLRALAIADPGREHESDAAGAVQWLDDGAWLLLPLMVLMLIGFRRGSLALVLAVGVGLPLQVRAADPAALWQRPDQRADAALRAGDLEAARRLARDPMLAGAAAYRDGDHDAAAAAFALADSARGHYNRGNALARSGRFEDAIDAYREALARDPHMEDARFNLELVEAHLRRPPPSPAPGGQEEEADGSAGDDHGDQDPSASGSPGGHGDPTGDRARDAAEGRDDPAAGAPGRDGVDDDPDQVDPTPGDGQDADTADATALREQAAAALADAVEQALADGAGEPPPAEAAAEDGDRTDAEQRQATDHWLRQVDDDPGGLLRRKFLIEHHQRRRGVRP